MNQHQTEKKLVRKLGFVSREKARAAFTAERPEIGAIEIFLVGSRFSTVGTFFFFFQEGKEADTLIKFRAKSGSARG